MCGQTGAIGHYRRRIVTPPVVLSLFGWYFGGNIFFWLVNYFLNLYCCSVLAKKIGCQKASRPNKPRSKAASHCCGFGKAASRSEIQFSSSEHTLPHARNVFLSNKNPNKLMSSSSDPSRTPSDTEKISSRTPNVTLNLVFTPTKYTCYTNINI